MTQSRNKKKALYASVLSLVVCLAMFIGTTLAWFTDTASSTGNKLVTGNLDVELEYTKLGSDGSLGEWESVDGAILFDESKQWEPGHTEVVYLKVENKGTLAADYTFKIDAKDNAVGTNADGRKIKLSDFLEFSVIETEDVFTTRTQAIEAAKANGTQSVAEGYTDKQTMEAGAEPKQLAMVIYMPKTVGNDANSVPQPNIFHNIDPVKYPDEFIIDYSSVELGISLVATQTPLENDDFGNDYDSYEKIELVAENDKRLETVIDKFANSTNKEYVSGDKEFEIELAPNTTYSKAFTVKQYPEWNGKLGADTNIDYKDVDSSDQIKVTFVGAKNTVLEGGVTVSGYGQNLGGNPETYSKNVSTVFENVTFKNATNLVSLNAGATNVTFKNCTFEGGNYISVGGARFDTVHNIKFIDCTFKDAGTISGYWSSMLMENCKGKMGAGGFINIQGGTVTTVKDSDISCPASTLKYVIRTNNQAKINFENSAIRATGTSPLLLLRGADCEIAFSNCELEYPSLVSADSVEGSTVVIDGEQVFPSV